MFGKIKFLIKYCDNIVNGKTKLENDGSIVFHSSVAIEAFSLYPYHWSLELTTKKINNKQYMIQYAMGALGLINCIQKQLKIPMSHKGRIYIDFPIPIEADGIYYNQYAEFVEKKYFDRRNNILAIGDIETTKGVCVEFASNQYAFINENNELKAIYIKFDIL